MTAAENPPLKDDYCSNTIFFLVPIKSSGTCRLILDPRPGIYKSFPQPLFSSLDSSSATSNTSGPQQKAIGWTEESGGGGGGVMGGIDAFSVWFLQPPPLIFSIAAERFLTAVYDLRLPAILNHTPIRNSLHDLRSTGGRSINNFRFMECYHWFHYTGV